MWMAWDHYRRTNLSNKISIEFITGMPTMFSVPKYSEALNALRIKRGIEAKFSHNLTSIDPKARVATFSAPEGKTFETEYTILHVTPPQGPPSFIKNSPLADSAGWVDVDPASLRHKKFGNVFSLGDGSSLPTSKTAAAITAQAPVLVENLIKVIGSGDVNVNAKYDGYTSCPVRNVSRRAPYVGITLTVYHDVAINGSKGADVGRVHLRSETERIVCELVGNR
jgi:NADPH-dependent 2,4-dienoyl-CoA reductase/sulfur reductase-like enzyme